MLMHHSFEHCGAGVGVGVLVGLGVGVRVGTGVGVAVGLTVGVGVGIVTLQMVGNIPTKIPLQSRVLSPA